VAFGLLAGNTYKAQFVWMEKKRMKVDDLKTLSEKLNIHTQKTKTESLYQQFSQILSNSLRNNRQQSVSQQKEQLFDSLRSFDQISLTYSETHLFSVLGYENYVGSSAVNDIEAILHDENFDPHGVIQKIEAKQAAFQDFLMMNQNLQKALQRIPTFKDVALHEGEALLEITFTDKAAVDNIVDFEGWIDSWTKIIRAFSELVGEKPENSRIVFVQKSSPLIIDIATACSLVLMLGKAVDFVLVRVERYLNIRKQVEEIRKLKLDNKKIEKDLEAEAESFSDKSAQEIADLITSEMGQKPGGEVINGISLSIRKLFVFIDKGGRVDCPSSSDKDEGLSDIFKEVRQLQKTVDKLRLLPAPATEKKTKNTGNK
jgi:hypothetical protein